MQQSNSQKFIPSIFLKKFSSLIECKTLQKLFMSYFTRLCFISYSMTLKSSCFNCFFGILKYPHNLSFAMYFIFIKGIFNALSFIISSIPHFCLTLICRFKYFLVYLLFKAIWLPSPPG